MINLVNFSLQKMQKFIKIKIQLAKYVKMANFALLEFQKLENKCVDLYEFLHFLKAEINQMNQSRNPKMAKTVVLKLLVSAKLISRKI